MAKNSVELIVPIWAVLCLRIHYLNIEFFLGENVGRIWQKSFAPWQVAAPLLAVVAGDVWGGLRPSTYGPQLECLPEPWWPQYHPGH